MTIEELGLRRGELGKCYLEECSRYAVVQELEVFGEWFGNGGTGLEPRIFNICRPHIPHFMEMRRQKREKSKAQEIKDKESGKFDYYMECNKKIIEAWK